MRRSIEGITSEQGQFFHTPSDAQIAAGPRYYVEMVNSRIRIVQRSNNTQLGPDLTFSELTSCGINADDYTDPRIRFDLASNRFFYAVAAQGANKVCFGVSTNDDPILWYRYSFSPPSGDFPDYPGLGITENKVIITMNLPDGFLLSTHTLVLNKDDLCSGRNVVHSAYFGGGSFGALYQPAMRLDSGAPAYEVGRELDFSPTDSTVLSIRKITGVPGTGAVTRSSQSVSLGTVWGERLPARQKGTSVFIDTGDSRVLDAVQVGERLIIAANGRCEVPPGQVTSCARFAEIQNADSPFSPQLITQRTLGGLSTSDDYYYPALSVDGSGNVLVVVNRSSREEYVSVYASGWRPTDPPASIRTPILLRAGEAPYDPADPDIRRWGDYQGASRDPSNASNVVVVGQYAKQSDPQIFPVRWGTWIQTISSQTIP